MSPELIAIVLVGSLLAIAGLVTFTFAMRALREINGTRRAVAGSSFRNRKRFRRFCAHSRATTRAGP